ncbi:MAG: hypothetical protein D3917_09135 [Candidatus Electrothrix sp. AX5]|nr:hypothetical protein [Candidatus Electrothrix sp. AX5]
MYAMRMCCVVLLTLFVGCGNVSAKKFDEGTVSAINLDVLRIEACASGKGCIAASGPMQLDLLELADGKVDFANKVLLPEKTQYLQLMFGDNSTITVGDELFPLSVPGGTKSGLKLKGRKAFGKEGGFLTSLELQLKLRKKIVVQRNKIRSKDKGQRRQVSYVYSYKLKPVIRVRSAEITQFAWSSRKLIIEQFQGTANRYSLTITAAKDARNVSLQVVPELQKIIHVLPDALGDIQKEQEIPLTVIVGFPVDMPVGELDGAILLQEAARNTTANLPVELIVKKWERGDLPADPGEAGKQALLGIDIDNDGVRDDVQIAIARHYPEPEDENARLALEQFAASWQYAFGVYQLGDEEELYDVFSEINPAVSCIAATSSKSLEDIVFVKLIVRNTKARVQAYADINDTAIGRTFPVYSASEEYCKR